MKIAALCQLGVNDVQDLQEWLAALGNNAVPGSIFAVFLLNEPKPGFRQSYANAIGNIIAIQVVQIRDRFAVYVCF